VNIAVADPYQELSEVQAIGVIDRFALEGAFMHIRLVPIGPVPDAWLVAGSMSAYRKFAAAQIAEVALAAVTNRPELVYRNPEKIEQVWTLTREDRAAFVEFFGGDEVVLPPGEAGERLNVFVTGDRLSELIRR